MTAPPRRLTLAANGVCSGARFIASPNADARPADARCELIVVHNISLPPNVFDGDAVQRFFTNQLNPAEHPYFAEIASLRVSAHFFLRRDGGLIQFVECDQRAWHAGVSAWRGRPRCNDYAIGIELEGADTTPYDDAQYQALARLIRVLCRAYPIAAVIGHEHIAPGRKTDPGPAFDWRRLWRASRLPKAMFAEALAAAQSVSSPSDASNSA